MCLRGDDDSHGDRGADRGLVGSGLAEGRRCEASWPRRSDCGADGVAADRSTTRIEAMTKRDVPFSGTRRRL